MEVLAQALNRPVLPEGAEVPLDERCGNPLAAL
jgi:hypothetical protein